MKYIDPSGELQYLTQAFSGGSDRTSRIDYANNIGIGRHYSYDGDIESDGGGGGGSSTFGRAGQGGNGSGYNGYYYDWSTGQYRTVSGKSVQTTSFVNNAITPNYGSYVRKDAYAGSGGIIVYKGTTWKYVPASGIIQNGGTLAQSGDKFYTESGSLIWDTEMKGSPNRVFVIPDNKLKGYNAKLELHKGWHNTGAHQLAYSRKIGTEVNTIIMGDVLFTYPQRSWKDVAALITFFGEGFAAGYGKGYYYKSNPGLSKHYGDYPSGATDYWNDYYEVNPFTPWW